MKGSKLVVPIKAVEFVVKGNLADDVKLEGLRLFLDQEATRKGIKLDVSEPVLQGRVEGKDEFFSTMALREGRWWCRRSPAPIEGELWAGIGDGDVAYPRI